MALTLKQKERFIELRSEGISFNSIAKKMNVSKTTLIALQTELNQEINDLIFLKAETLLEKHKLGEIAKIAYFVKQLDKINKELDKRNLTEVNFRDLLIYKETVETSLKSKLKKLELSTGKYYDNLELNIASEKKILLD